MRKNAAAFFILCYALLQWSCSGTRNLKENEYLLITNEITIRNQRSLINIEAVNKINEKINSQLFAKLTDELTPLIKQHPNRRLLTRFPLYLWVYNISSKGKERKIKKWLKNTVGEEPVIYDSLLTKKTRDQFRLYLLSKGYFNASVIDTVIFRKNKTASVNYIVYTEKPYTIRTVSYKIKDKSIEQIILSNQKKSLIKSGNIYTSESLLKERENITTSMKDIGYYYFSKEYVFYEIDSSLGSHQVDITIGVNRVNESSNDSTASPSSHQKYFIGKVYVQTDFDPKNLNDTSRKDTIHTHEMIVIYSNNYLNVRPELLYRNIYLRSGDLFQGNNLDITYKLLAGLGLYKFINIRFAENKVDTSQHLIDCYIQLNPSFKQSLSEEIEGTNNGGNFGIGGNIAYRNKNTFRGAEILDLKFSGGLENQRNSDATNIVNSPVKQVNVFNTIQYSPSASISFPKFFLPFKVHTGRNTKPKTVLTASYIFQQRTDYTRKVAALSYGYTWFESKNKKWIINPFDVNLVDIPDSKISETFREKLQKEKAGVQASYKPHFIPAGRYSFIFNTQDINVKRNFVYYRITMESAGNLFYGLTEGYNYLSGTKYTWYFADKKTSYSQYLRPDIDFKFYHVINQHNTIVYHAGAGVGFALGNSTTLPFEKSFYGGGANDLRGWHIRQIGPGSFSNDSTTYERTGDLKFSANVEYRFNLFRFFQGALFTDAGNIWSRHFDPNRPGAYLDLSKTKFLDEIGIASGLGLRLDFSFMVIRVDYGVRMKDPGEKEGARWVVTNTPIKRLLSPAIGSTDPNHLKPFGYSALQFGVGYPF